LQCEHHAGEQAGEQHDPERPDADLVHLLHDVMEVERSREDESQRLASQNEVLLQRQDLAFRRVIDPGEYCRQNEGSVGFK
jgi:hypothetical protein